MSAETEDRPYLFGSPVRFALVLACLLWGLVLILNWLGPAEMPIDEDQFQKLWRDGSVEQIAIGIGGLHCQLKRMVRVSRDGRAQLTEQAFVERPFPVEEDEVEAWREAGIAVVIQDIESQNTRKWGGLILVIGLLGVGVWHLWSQVQKDRRGAGSPRRRLQQLEEAFKAGKIGPEEYQKKAETIWAEM